MMRYFHAVIIVLTLLVAQIVFAANIIIKTDRDHVSLGETFSLVILLQDNISSPPFIDFSPLNKDFKILGTGQSSQFSIINGNTTSLFRWVLTLTPLHAGKLMIPSLYINNSKTSPIEMVVSSTSGNSNAIVSSKDANKLLFLDVQVNTKYPYVQSAVLYTVKLYYKDDIQGFNNTYLNDPVVENGNIKLSNNDKSYATTINHIHYRVFERRYLITPQKSGSLIINPVTMQGELIKNVTIDDPMNIGPNISYQPFRLEGPVIKFDIRSKPASYNASWWLPAKKVSLTASGSNDINSVKLGEPLVRTVTLTAVGIAASQLPEIPKTALPGLNVYSEEVKLETSIVNDEVVAKRIEKIAYIPTSSGNMTLPDLQIPWWNIIENRAETAILSGQKIFVTADKNATATAISPQSAVTSIQKSLPNSVVTPLSNKLTAKIPLQSLWFWCSIILLFLWLITLLIWKKPWCYLRLSNLVGKSNASPRKTLSAIKKACKANDAFAAKNSLFYWLKLQGFSGKNLDELKAIISAEDFKLALQELKEHLYFNKKITWDGQKFWEIFSKNCRLKSVTIQPVKKTDLPELYL